MKKKLTGKYLIDMLDVISGEEMRIFARDQFDEQIAESLAKYLNTSGLADLFPEGEENEFLIYCFRDYCREVNGYVVTIKSLASDFPSVVKKNLFEVQSQRDFEDLVAKTKERMGEVES